MCPFCDGRRVARVPFPDRGGKAAPARARESGRRWGASVRVVLEPPAVRPELVARRQDDRLRRGIRTADRPEARCRRCRADVHDQRGQAVLVAGGRRDRLLDGADRAVSVRAQGHDERRSNDADGGGPVRRSERDAAGRYRATRLVSRRQAHRVRASTGDLERAFCGRAGHSAGGRWPTWNTPRTCTVLRQRRSAARIRQVVRQRPRRTDRLAARRTRPPKRPRAHTRERIDESRGVAHGPQSWSPDSDEVAYAEGGTTGASVRIARSDGSGSRSLVQRAMADAPAWGGGGPNYYIKDVEVTQAISPALDSPSFDPLLPDEYTLHWSQPSPFGFALPLVAEKSTLLRVYIGDSSLPEGATERRSLHVSVVDNSTSIPYGPSTAREVDVTARDVAPQQDTERAAMNIWVPPEAAGAGGTHSFKVEVNVDQEQPECAACYPNGNRATVKDIRHDEGGSVVIAPVPIHIINADGVTVDRPAPRPRELDRRGRPDAARARRRRYDHASTAPEEGLLVKRKDLTAAHGCDSAPEAARAESYRRRSLGGTRRDALGRVLGFTGVADGVEYCAGKAQLFGRNMVLLGPIGPPGTRARPHPRSHAPAGDQPRPGGRRLPLTYAGIGGVGTKSGAGGVTDVFSSPTTGDIMGYDRSSDLAEDVAVHVPADPG